MIRRNLVCRFVLSATLVPIAVSRNPEENEPVIMSSTGGMAATAAHTAGSPGHSALHQRQTPPANINQSQSTSSANLIYQSER